MEFRPCIDIHNGKVKQIVGGSLKDAGDQAAENFVAEQDAAYFAKLYQKEGIKGGHIILLNPVSSEYYKATREQAEHALLSFFVCHCPAIEYAVWQYPGDAGPGG